MKSLEEKHERAPAAVAPADISSILRTEAEQYREHYPNASDDVVRARLRELVKGNSWRVDEAQIDEAVRSAALGGASQ